MRWQGARAVEREHDTCSHCYCSPARTCSTHFDRRYLRSDAASGARNWSPRTAIVRRTHLSARTSVPRASPLLTKAKTSNASSLHASSCQAAHVQPATGAAGVQARRRRRSWSVRRTGATDLPGNANLGQLRAHVVAGSTAVERAAVKKWAAAEVRSGRAAAQVLRLRREASSFVSHAE